MLLVMFGIVIWAVVLISLGLLWFQRNTTPINLVPDAEWPSVEVDREEDGVPSYGLLSFTILCEATGKRRMCMFDPKNEIWRRDSGENCTQCNKLIMNDERIANS